MWATWDFTVVSARKSVSAISRLDLPRASSRKTSTSRALQGAEGLGLGSWAPNGGERLDQALGDDRREQRVTDLAVRTAATSCSGGTSLRRNPVAPACRAS